MTSNYLLKLSQTTQLTQFSKAAGQFKNKTVAKVCSFFHRASSLSALSSFVSVFFVEGGWCRGGERRGESRSTFALRMRKSSSIFSPPPPPPTVVVESIGSVYYVIIPVPVYSTKHAVAHIYFRFFPSHRRLSATLSKPRAKPARLPSMALVVSAVTF